MVEKCKEKGVLREGLRVWSGASGEGAGSPWGGVLGMTRVGERIGILGGWGFLESVVLRKGERALGVLQGRESRC